MAEYAEPLGHFRRERIRDTVVFFGSARFHALDIANHELELLARPYSSERAPHHEQPAKGAELDDCSANELKCRRAEAALEMARYYEDARKLAHMLTDWAKTLKGRSIASSSLRRWSGNHGSGQSRSARGGGPTIGLNIKLPFERHRTLTSRRR